MATQPPVSISPQMDVHIEAQNPQDDALAETTARWMRAVFALSLIHI